MTTAAQTNHEPSASPARMTRDTRGAILASSGRQRRISGGVDPREAVQLLPRWNARRMPLTSIPTTRCVRQSQASVSPSPSRTGRSTGGGGSDSRGSPRGVPQDQGQVCKEHRPREDARPGGPRRPPATSDQGPTISEDRVDQDDRAEGEDPEGEETVRREGRLPTPRRGSSAESRGRWRPGAPGGAASGCPRAGTRRTARRERRTPRRARPGARPAEHRRERAGWPASATGPSTQREVQTGRSTRRPVD